jgi:hypothetical protein
MAEVAGADNASQIALEQCHSRAFDRDIGPRAHGDADVGWRPARAHRSFTVAGHGNDPPCSRQALDDRALLALWRAPSASMSA